MKTRKRGKFLLSKDIVFDNLNYKVTNAIFNNVVVYNVDQFSIQDCFMYFCESELFEPVEQGMLIPEYVCTIHTSLDENDRPHYTATFKKVE